MHVGMVSNLCEWSHMQHLQVGPFPQICWCMWEWSFHYEQRNARNTDPSMVLLPIASRVRSFPEIENWSENLEIYKNENLENSEFKTYYEKIKINYLFF